MGRYTHPCPTCGQQIVTKTQVNDSSPIAHRLCASCEEKAREKLLAEVNAKENAEE